MTTIRNKKALRRYIDHATPDDRLRHSAGMGMGEPDRLSPPVWPIVVVLILLAVYIAPDVIAWARGEVPVMVGRMK